MFLPTQKNIRRSPEYTDNLAYKIMGRPIFEHDLTIFIPYIETQHASDRNDLKKWSLFCLKKNRKQPVVSSKYYIV